VPAAVAAISSASFSLMYGMAVTAILPAYDLDEDSFSSFSTRTDDSDLPTCDT
jgi:hypothetical protein